MGPREIVIPEGRTSQINSDHSRLVTEEKLGASHPHGRMIITGKVNETMQITRKDYLIMHRKYGCLVANINRLARDVLKCKEILDPKAILLGSRDTAIAEALPPSSRADVRKVLDILSGGRKDELLRGFD